MIIRKIGEELDNSLHSYIALAEARGDVGISKMNGVLMLDFIYDILTSGLSDYIDEEDYNLIAKAIYCITGKNCLVNYMDFKEWLPTVGKPGFDFSDLFHRVTEDYAWRYSEDSEYRDKE